MRVTLFTDTLGETNGVSRFITDAADQAMRTQRDLKVMASTRNPCPDRANITNFRPHYAKPLSKYPELELVVPPAMKMWKQARKHDADVIHVSTPGPVGLVGAMAAWAQQKPLLGVYHTDLPAYMEDLYGKKAMRKIMEGYIKGFYKAFAGIITRSEEYVETLKELGIPEQALSPLPPGTDLSQFHPGFARPDFWAGEEYARLGIDPDAPKALYVGRVSKEKNMALLEAAWRAIPRDQVAPELLIVGDGPYRPELQARIDGPDVHFLGYRSGTELSHIYANSDVFVFPSTTDTLGQVVMESQASGLPALVTDVGGPQNIVEDGRTGHVLSAKEPAEWGTAIGRLLGDNQRRETMGHAAYEHMQGFTFANSFEAWWGSHIEAWLERKAESTAPSLRP